MKTQQIIEDLARTYAAAVSTLRGDIAAFAQSGTLPPPERIADRAWCYPELRVHYTGRETHPDASRAFGRLSDAGTYATTVTKPELFAPYLTEQLDLLAEDYAITVEVGRSEQQIPFPYVLDASSGITARPWELAQHFPSTDLALIGDELADGIVEDGGPDASFPLALFDGLRTDFSLARLAHYTGTSTEHFQRFILFTNYHRYVDAFVRESLKTLRRGGGRYEALSCAGGVVLDPEDRKSVV